MSIWDVRQQIESHVSFWFLLDILTGVAGFLFGYWLNNRKKA